MFYALEFFCDVSKSNFCSCSGVRKSLQARLNSTNFVSLNIISEACKKLNVDGAFHAESSSAAACAVIRVKCGFSFLKFIFAAAEWLFNSDKVGCNMPEDSMCASSATCAEW